MKKLLALATVLALVGVTSPVFAASDDILVQNTNSVSLTNVTTAQASTGNNTSDGGSARNRTYGGNVDDANASNEAGNGGSTVLGGMGGEIRTGNAVAMSDISNTLNTNRTRISVTPWAVHDIDVMNSNSTSLTNTAVASAVTDGNTSSGARARNKISGGNVDDVNFDNSAGNEGSHVEGGSGGLIVTGHAESYTSVVNRLNHNITRIRK